MPWVIQGVDDSKRPVEHVQGMLAFQGSKDTEAHLYNEEWVQGLRELGRWKDEHE